MRIALFGGSFDPVHAGHLEVAKAAADRYSLDRVLFIPSGRPPHKDATLAEYEHRFRMVELACEADPRFEASRLEDPALTGPGATYSAHTIERVRSQLAPADELFFLLGKDAFEDLEIWFRLDDVLRMTEFIVAARPSLASGKEGPPGARVHWLGDVNNPVSATDVRRRLRRGEPTGGMLPDAVAGYVAAHGLYA